MVVLDSRPVLGRLISFTVIRLLLYLAVAFVVATDISLLNIQISGVNGVLIYVDRDNFVLDLLF